MNKLNTGKLNKLSIHNKLKSRLDSTAKKTILKNWRGDTIAVSDYLTKEDIKVADIELKFKGVPLETADKILDIIAPLYDNPYKQLELNFEKEED